MRGPAIPFTIIDPIQAKERPLDYKARAITSFQRQIHGNLMKPKQETMSVKLKRNKSNKLSALCGTPVKKHKSTNYFLL